MKKAVLSRHESAVCARMRADYLDLFGAARTVRRAEEIATLPSVEWHGRRLHTLRCHGDFGRGPHDMNVPESLLWSLLSFARYRCPYHAGGFFPDTSEPKS